MIYTAQVRDDNGKVFGHITTPNIETVAQVVGDATEDFVRGWSAYIAPQGELSKARAPMLYVELGATS